MEKMPIEQQLILHFERQEKVKPLATAILRAPDWRSRLAAIQSYYAFVRLDFYQVEPWQWAYDPYEVDWPMLFTPIESALWSDIRALGIPMYPQYPMEVEGGKHFFADFANPRRRISFECDGKAFHDATRDRERDRLLGEAGWKVFRFSGTECRGDEVARQLEKLARAYLLPETEQPKPKREWLRGGFDE
jgi:very-short-patch-repair endonuclease